MNRNVGGIDRGLRVFAGLALLCLLQAMLLPPAQRWLQPATARVGLVLASIAATFFAGVVAKYWLFGA